MVVCNAFELVTRVGRRIDRSDLGVRRIVGIELLRHRQDRIGVGGVADCGVVPRDRGDERAVSSVRVDESSRCQQQISQNASVICGVDGVFAWFERRSEIDGDNHVGAVLGRVHLGV